MAASGLLQLDNMGFEIDQIEACQLALASSNSPLTLQAATEWWFACLILTLSFGGLAFLLIHVSCPFSQLFLLLSVMFLRVGFVVFFLLVCLLRIMLTFVSPFCLLFFFFSRLLQQACHAAAPNWSWQGEKEARGSGDSQTGWNTEDWRECNTRGSETI